VPLPALIFGGTGDPLIPYRGGKYLYALGFMDPARSIEDTVKVWRELAELHDAPDIVRIAKRDARDKTSVTRSMWGADPHEHQVGLYRIEHGGHAEPSRLKRYPYFINKLVGLQNADIEVAEAAWEFFKDKRAKPVANAILEPALSPERTRAPENAHRAEISSAPNTPSAHPSHAA
jgi:polyhydroxybutyrate depolymerase